MYKPQDPRIYYSFIFISQNLTLSTAFSDADEVEVYLACCIYLLNNTNSHPRRE